MTAMTVTTWHESYELRLGHDPDVDQDVLVRTYADGTVTVSFRPGKGATDETWSPEVEVREPTC